MKQEVTFDGMDGGLAACPHINIWKSYGDRGAGVVTTVEHGSKGILLERKGNRCKVQIGEHVGYLTYWFILELKAKYQEKRIQEQAGD